MTILHITWRDFPKDQQQWIKSIDERAERERKSKMLESYKKSLDWWMNPPEYITPRPKDVVDRAVEIINKRITELGEA